MASTARTDELKKKFDENPRRYFAPLANEFRKAGDIEQAILICEEFLPQQPGHMSGHIVYGQALYEAGRLPESRGVFETALGLDPENLIALRHLGDIARGEDDLTSARMWYVRVLDADPRNDEIQGLIASLDGDSTVGGATAASTAPARADDQSDVATQIVAAVKPVEEPRWLSDVRTTEIPQVTPHFDMAHDRTSPLGVPVIPPPLPSPRHADPADAHDLLDGFSLAGLESHHDASGSETEHASGRAEGLEPTEFMPPEEAVAEADDLDDTLESGVPSFSVPSLPVPSLAGLEGSGASAHALDDDALEDAEPSSFPQLDVDDGFVLPPQGDPLAESVHASESHADDSESGFDLEMPGVEEHDTIPEELPPAVIAAEAELTEADTAPLATAAAEERAPAPQPFVTETMAELYLAQGLKGKAQSVYEQLAAANPGDARLRARLDALQRVDVSDDGKPNVREFFARLASRRPGTRAAAAEPPSNDDFAEEVEPASALTVERETELSAGASDGEESVMIHELEVERETDPLGAPDFGASTASGSSAVAPAIERAAAMHTPPGSIDALFGNRPATKTEDSAAAALAQAFGGSEPDAPVISGRPARAASEELSLDSVFRDGPSRPSRSSQSFSFDQFFSEGAATTAGERASATPRASHEIIQPGHPAERSADDIEQFNSWLQGLKPR